MQQMHEIWVQSLGGQKDPLEEEMATHSLNSCLENPMGRGAWQATIHGVAKSWPLWAHILHLRMNLISTLSTFTSLPFSSCLMTSFPINYLASSHASFIQFSKNFMVFIALSHPTILSASTLFFIITHPTLILLSSYHSVLSINVNFLQKIFSLI